MQEKKEGSQYRGERSNRKEIEEKMSHWGYRLRPTPSSHWGWGELIQPEGKWEPWGQQCVAWRIAMHMQLHIKPHHKPLNKVCYFFCIGESQLTKHSIRFMAKEAISRHYEGSEVALLSKTRNKIFLLLHFIQTFFQTKHMIAGKSIIGANSVSDKW